MVRVSPGGSVKFVVAEDSPTLRRMAVARLEREAGATVVAQADSERRRPRVIAHLALRCWFARPQKSLSTFLCTCTRMVCALSSRASPSRSNPGSATKSRPSAKPIAHKARR